MKNKNIFLALAALLALPFAAQAQMSVQDQLAKVQQAIKEQGARWEAGETSVSNLSREEFQNYIGFDFSLSDAEPAPEVTVMELPAALDWRDNNGNFVTIPKDQKKCGSCWAFSMTGALESYVLRTQNKPGQDLDLSEQVMLSCSGAGTCNGGRLTAGFLKKTGLPLDNVYPYNATDSACSAAAPGWQAAAYKIGNYGSVSQKVASLKAALAAYGPLPTAYMVYEDFKLYKGGIYSYTTGKRLGGHAVLLVGYNDAEQYFIVKNSWTPQWGEGGYFRIAYSEVNGKSSFGLMTIAYYTAKDLAETAAWQRAAPLFENLNWN
jgi:C1A family cysteine protease